jgi:putative FmdB family regulatory protein
MPTYEYECKKCGHNFEVFQSMSDEPVKTCTKCGSEVRRLIFGGAGVIFKGSGFYVTDKADKTSGKRKTPSGASCGGASSDAKTKTAETSASETAPATPSPSTDSDTKKAEAKPAAKTA